MKTISGITITDDMYEEIASQHNAGIRVFIEKPENVITLESISDTGCANCNGSGSLIFSWITDGPFGVPPTHAHVQEVDGMWYTGGRKTYPCPVCRIADRTLIRSTLAQDSGLVDDEFDYHLDYIDDMAGKDIALNAARELLTYGRNVTGFHTFFGDYGVGKSGILKSIVAAMLRMGVKAKYMRASEMLMVIRSTYNRDSENYEAQVMNDFASYQLFAIDEVDRVSTTDWGMSTLFSILDERYNLRKSRATLIATNQIPDQMGGEWGYLMSRMEDGHRVPVGGKTLRGYKHAD